MLASLYFSFTRWTLVEPPAFIGLDNYGRFVEDKLWLKSLVITCKYTIGSVPIGMTLAFLLAMLLNQKIPGTRLFRTVFYLPTLVPATANSILWLFMFNAKIGVVNGLLRLVGVEGPPWLGSTRWALPALVIMSFWTIGGGMVIFLAGLQGIPEHMYEAAKIDGANQLQEFAHVTIPMMTPVIFFDLIMSVIGTFQTFNTAYVMTQGGPAQATYFYVLYLYMTSFHHWTMGYGCAMAWFLFIIVMLLTLVNFRLSKMWVYYEAGETI